MHLGRCSPAGVISPEENMNKDFNKEFNDIRLKQYSIAMEALNHLFHRIPFGEEIQFSDNNGMNQTGKTMRFT
jgi:hypothetical protein